MLVVLPNAYGDAATNMAIDAALLESIPVEATTFRHYGWKEPTITFGYSQGYAEVSARTAGDVNLCRRMTGGGIVDHRNDWTYSLAIGRASPAAERSSTELYEIVHTAISVALADQGLETRLAPCPRKCNTSTAKAGGPDVCFIQPVMNDVLDAEGRKIAGAAMKRTRKGLLIQGSLDLGALRARIDYLAFSGALIENLLCPLELERHQPEDLRAYFPSDVIEREKTKFASGEWTKRR